MSPRRVLPALLAAAASIYAADANAAAKFKFVYDVDQASGTGFYDPTPAAPVGGNTGRTLGEQRRMAFEYAAKLWAQVLTSSVEIVVDASFQPLFCESGSAVLAHAGPASAFEVTRSINGVSKPLYHVVALANAIEGTDLEPPDSLFNPSGADILAEFNSRIDDEGCLGSHTFYYGLDTNESEENGANFMTTALHELGHGLGFISLLDDYGFQLYGPDIYSEFAFDNTAGKNWNAMTDAGRESSRMNARQLVWSGPNVTAHAADFLKAGAPELSVSPPVTRLMGMVSEHNKGPKLSGVVSGPLVVPNPPTGCDTPTNASELRGAIALVQPSDCVSIQAVANMQALGAAAVLVNDPFQDVLPPANMHGIYADQTIVALQIAADDGDALATQAVGRTVTLRANANRFLGTDEQKRLYLYAANPLNGSAGDHWDPSARTDLLMEPEDSPEITGIDITRYFMQDIGWPVCGDKAKTGAEACDDGNSVDNDGCSAVCTPEVCGDGDVNQTSEQCDDGNTTAGDGCGPTCKDEVCGDGSVNQSSEVCDDGNTTSGDGCSANCKPEVCGDGNVNQSSEVCDDGNTTSGDGCSATCTSETKGGGGSGGGGDGDGGGEDDGGCGCKVGPRAPASSAWVALGLGLLLARFRRRIAR